MTVVGHQELELAAVPYEPAPLARVWLSGVGVESRVWYVAAPWGASFAEQRVAVAASIARSLLTDLLEGRVRT